MTELKGYKIYLTDDDGRMTIYTTGIATLSSSDEEHSINLIVGKEYTVVVHSENSVGFSQAVSTSFGKFNLVQVTDLQCHKML